MCCQVVNHLLTWKNKFSPQACSYSLLTSSINSLSFCLLPGISFNFSTAKKNYYVRPKPTPESQPSRKKHFVFNGFWLSRWMEDGGGGGGEAGLGLIEPRNQLWILDIHFIFFTKNTVLGCIHIHCTSIHHVYVHVWIRSGLYCITITLLCIKRMYLHVHVSCIPDIYVILHVIDTRARFTNLEV